MKRKVIVVDDVEINRDILEEILEGTYEVITASNGKEAVELIEKHADDIATLLLDLIMPEMDGFAVLEYLQEKEYLKRIPVIIITGDNSAESEKKCLAYGVVDFVRKPFNENVVQLRVGNVVELYSYKKLLEDRVEEQTQVLMEQYRLLEKQALQLSQSNQKIIDVLGTVVESRNLESGQHIQRVKSYTNILANCVMNEYPEYGLTKHIVDVMTQASALHDTGKIAIPDSILLKPGKLTPEEFEIMKTHTTQGCLILDNIQGAWDEEYAKMSYTICRHHHEKYDGKGYPDGLKGDDIPIEAQIVSVADIYDALINQRCYKDAYGKEKAFNMILNGECGAFSEKIMNCLKMVRMQFEAV